MSSSSTFKVIIVGGGPVGLSAALALQYAGVDFVMLEQRPEIVIDAGSNLVLLLKGLRILSQLGLYETINKKSSPLGDILRFDHDGHSLGSAQWFHLSERSFGDVPRVISRHDLTLALFDGLSEESKSKLYSNKKVSTIDVVDTGNNVTVSCLDGTSFTGSMVIGADGTHSITRKRMRTLAIEAGTEDLNVEQPFLSTYRCLWIRFPTTISTNLKQGMTAECHGYGASTQMFSGEETAVTGLYERLDEPSRERPRFTKEDEEAIVARWGHLPLNHEGDITLKRAYESRMQAGVVSLEEGVLDHWSWGGRMVLVGDAAHKFTPHTGEGCNNGITDVVVLANHLRKAVAAAAARSSSSSSAALPTKEDLTAAFDAYQTARAEDATACCEQSGRAAAMSTWGNSIMRIFDRYIIPVHAFQRVMFRYGAKKVALNPVFDYIEGEEKYQGKVPWAMPIASRAAMVA